MTAIVAVFTLLAEDHAEGVKTIGTNKQQLNSRCRIVLSPTEWARDWDWAAAVYSRQ